MCLSSASPVRHPKGVPESKLKAWKEADNRHRDKSEERESERIETKSNDKGEHKTAKRKLVVLCPRLDFLDDLFEEKQSEGDRGQKNKTNETQKQREKSDTSKKS